jgi:ribosomal protein L15
VQPPAHGHNPLEIMTNQEYYEISAEDNDENVTELVKHVAEKVEGVTVKTKEGGSIKMTGDAKITMTGGAIKIG